MKIRTRKGIGGLSDNAIALVVAAVAIGIGATIMGTIQDDQVTGAAGCNATATTACGVDYNTSASVLEGLDTFSDNLTTLALVIVFGIILFFLGRYLVRR